MFNDRKSFILRCLEKVADMVDAGGLSAKLSWKKETHFDQQNTKDLAQEAMSKRGWGDLDVTEFKKLK